MAHLNELEGLGAVTDFQVDYDNIPDQPGGYSPPPQPGTYRLRLPKDLSDVWETFDVTINGKPTQRVRARFEEASALTITQSKNGTYDGDSFSATISNAERKRNKEGLMASDMLYLLRALGDEGKYKDNLQYAKALQVHAGEEVIGDIEWSAWCNDKKDVRALDENGQVVTVEGQTGCGARVYQRDLVKDPETGAYDRRVACPDCGYLLTAWANLVRFRPVPENK